MRATTDATTTTRYRIDQSPGHEPKFIISRILPGWGPTPILSGIETISTAQNIINLLKEDQAQGYVNGYRDGYLNGRRDGHLFLNPPSLEQLNLLNSEIHVLGLTVRTYNCLRREDITTVAELISKTERDIRDIRNLGEKSFTEIVVALGNHALSLRRKEAEPEPVDFAVE